MMRLKSELLAALSPPADGVLGTFDLRLAGRMTSALPVQWPPRGSGRIRQGHEEISGLESGRAVRGWSLHAGKRTTA